MVTKYAVDKTLQPFVRFLYSIKWERRNYKDRIEEMVLPSGTGFMGFQAIGRFEGTIYDKKMRSPKFYAIGQQTSFYRLFSDDDVFEVSGAAIAPTGLFHFFKLDMQQATNNPTIDAHTLFPDKLVEFSKSYELAASPKERVELIEKLLLKHYGSLKVKLNIIDIAVRYIDEARGCMPMKEIIQKLNVSERYFQKKFKEMTGIPPSVYSRIIRFNYLFSQMQPNAPIDYQTLSALCNYYDFSHFSKDFKRYCGQSPSEFHIGKFKLLKEAWVDNPFFMKSS